MLFYGKFVFCHFLMLFNGNSRIEKLGGVGVRTDGVRTNVGRMDRRTDGRTNGQMDRQMDEHKEIHPCVLQDVGPLGPLPKKCSNRTLMHHMVNGF